MKRYLFTDRVSNVPDAGIGTIMSFAAKFKDTVSLGQGAPQFKTPKFVYDELFERSKTDPILGMYNSTNDKIQTPLKELLLKNIESRYGFTPKNSELYLTVGGLGGLFAVFLSILEKGDEVIYFDPSYPLHLSQIAITGATPVFVPLNEENGWSIDIDKLKKSVTKNTKAVVLTNPNNPTGTVLSKEQVVALSKVIIDNDLYLVLDEAYEYLTYGESLFSPMFIPELRPHIILCKSFSKEYAMTGWRIGYMWAPEEIIKKVHNIHLHFSLNPATISVVAATIVLSDPRGQVAMEEFRAEIKKSRERICYRAGKLPKLFSFVKPMGSFYLFPKILPNIEALDFCKKLVEEAGVITIPGDSMGPSGKGHIRLSFSASTDVIDAAFDRIDAFAKKNGYV